MELKNLLTEFITNNQEKFYRLAYSYVRNQDAALDIVQNAIVKALENYSSIRNQKYIKTWFYRILVNECYNFIKKSKKELLYESEELQKYLENQEIKYDSNLEVYDYIFTLPENMKTVILLRFYEELSLAEIAKVTQVKLSTAKYRLYTALKQLRENFREVIK